MPNDPSRKAIRRSCARWAAALAFIFGVAATGVRFVAAAPVAVCDDPALRLLFLERGAITSDRPWRVVIDALTPELKWCILDRSVRRFGGVLFQTHVRFDGQDFENVSDGVIDAPASDLGYAAVFQANEAQGRTILKFGFNAYPDGTTNILNPFQMQIRGPDVAFFEWVDGRAVKRTVECLQCHGQSRRPDLTLGVVGLKN